MFKALDKWFPGYLRSVLQRPRVTAGIRHLIFCVCDHFEPFRGGAHAGAARQTVSDWLSAYPAATESFRDAEGRSPRHTFFYPQEEYDAPILDKLASFCRQGYGEVEIHLHHRHDTPEGFREKLITFRDLLHQSHGLLGVEDRVQGAGCRVQGAGNSESEARLDSSPLLPEPRTLNPEPRYGFIHGNWALCNSRPDGDWCGVNEELGILAETGCYADFTFPSAPSPTQSRMVNAVYYAHDTPGRPRGADGGERVGFRVQGSGFGAPASAQAPAGMQRSVNRSSKSQSILNPETRPLDPSPPLLIITGPLALNWRRRKWGILPRLENAEITGINPPTSDRIRLWAEQQIGVGGRPDWVFVKVHTHGCVPANARVLLGETMREAHRTLQQEFNDGQNWQLHYVTAREMHNLIKAAELNLPGSPGLYRDWQVKWS